MRGHARVRGLSLSIALLTCSLWPRATADVRAQAPDDREASRLESTVDPSIAPGDDFFAYANGAWLKSAVLPTGRGRWAVRDDINVRTRTQVAAILDDGRTASPGSLARKVADFRAAFLDRAAIEQRGVAPLSPALAWIDRAVNGADLARLLGGITRADVEPLDAGTYISSSVLGLSVAHSIHGETGYTAFLVQGGLGLGDREAYLSQAPEAVARRGRYRHYIAHVLTLAGFAQADRRAQAVLALETAIAETHATADASANDRNADHRWTRAELAREAPGLDWAAFLDGAGLTGQPALVAWQPSAVKGVAALAAARPLAVWKDYLRFHAIHEHVDVLPAAFADAARALRDDTRPRDAQAAAATEAAMADAIGELYAARYFSPAEKARVRGVVANVAKAFRARVAAAAWLSPASRTTALAKLDVLYVGVGYPETWDRWTDLRIDAADAFGNADRLARRSYRRALARLDRPFDRQLWTIPPQTAGALLNFQQNAYLFAAALLQPPKYDAAASEAAAYGAIGAIIGHDVSHFVDLLGADYEPDGRMRHWWTPGDAAGFETAAAPLVRQAAACEPLPGMHVDGMLTRSENVADLAGLAAAFDAYRAAVGAKAADAEILRRQDREFFIAFAQAFGARMDDQAMRAQLANDHAPEACRMNTVRNLDAWYAAFDVVPGQRLYVEPGARVRIW